MTPAYEPVNQDSEAGQSSDRRCSSGSRRKKSILFAGIGLGVLVSAIFVVFAQGDLVRGSFFSSPATGAEKQSAGFLFV